ncbi:hypothetical protein BURK1_02543 [Burkholderiales bacterium]|nr:hypothetical protein BURK1_02543 [Burkholderiales bacterium]
MGTSAIHPIAVCPFRRRPETVLAPKDKVGHPASDEAPGR